MTQRSKEMLGFGAGFVLSIMAAFVVTDTWPETRDLPILWTFLLGIGVGAWAMRMWGSR